MQMVHSLEGRKGNSQGRLGVPGGYSTQLGALGGHITDQREVRSAPAMLKPPGHGDLLVSSLCSQACNLSCRNAVEGWNCVELLARKTRQKVAK